MALTIRLLPRRLKIIFFGMVLSFLLDTLFPDGFISEMLTMIHTGVAPFPFFHVYWLEYGNVCPFLYIAGRVLLLIPLVGIPFYNEHPVLYKWLTYLPYGVAVTTTVIWIGNSDLLHPALIPWMILKDILFLLVLIYPTVKVGTICWMTGTTVALTVAMVILNNFIPLWGNTLRTFPNGYSIEKSGQAVKLVLNDGESDEVVASAGVMEYCYNKRFVCVKRADENSSNGFVENAQEYIVVDFMQSNQYDACDTAEEFEAMCEELGITDLCEWIACS